MKSAAAAHMRIHKNNEALVEQTQSIDLIKHLR